MSNEPSDDDSLGWVEDDDSIDFVFLDNSSILSDDSNNSSSNEDSSVWSKIDSASPGDLILHKDWEAALERLQAHPEEAKEMPNCHLYANRLQQACHLEAPSKLIEELIRVYPEASKEKTADGLALHFIFRFDCYGDYHDEKITRLLLEANPDAALTKNSAGELPLHLAVRNDEAEYKAVLSLIIACPDAAKVTNNQGNLPLHLTSSLFCGSEGLCEIIGELLKANPRAVFEKGSDGELPLAKVMTFLWRLDEEKMNAFKFIFNANPDATKTACDKGNLPLHKFCMAEMKLSEHLHLELFETLLKANKNAILMPNNKGRLPLHLAVIHWPIQGKGLLSKLVGNYPRIIETPDNEGLTPLDYATKKSCNPMIFVRELFSLSSSGLVFSQMEKMTVVYAGAIKENMCLKKRVQDLEKELEKSNRTTA